MTLKTCAVDWPHTPPMAHATRHTHTAHHETRAADKVPAAAAPRHSPPTAEEEAGLRSPASSLHFSKCLY